MRGRKPLPSGIKKLRGTYRPHRDAGGLQPEPLDRLPRAPRTLSPRARRYWRELGRRLVEARVLTELDLPAFEVLCDLLGHVDAIRGQLLQLSPRERYTGPRGAPGPLLMRLLRQTWAEALRLAAEFGITPSSRERVRPLPSEGGDLLAELFGFSDN